MGGEIRIGAIVGGRTRRVSEAHGATVYSIERQPDIALALMIGVVHGHEHAGRWQPATRTPRSHPTSSCRPTQAHIRAAPVALAKGRPAQNREQPIVELLQRLVRRLDRRANQVRRDPLQAPLELPLMKEAQSW